MRAWILTKKDLNRHSAYLLGCVNTIFDHVTISRYDQLAERAPDPPEHIDLIIHRSNTKSRGFCEHLDAIARERGIPLSNPGNATWRSADKRCYPVDYPGLTPRTLVVSDMPGLRTARDDLGGDIVVKDPLADMGEKVERVRSDDDLALAEQLLTTSPCGEIVVQEYCGGFAKGDKRIIVQRTPGGDHEIIAHFQRLPPDGGWRSNLSTGGRMEPCELSAEEIQLAHHVARLSGLDYVGLDISEHAGRNLLIETNHASGGLITYDVAQSARSIEKVARFLLHLARHGRCRE